MTVVPFDSDHAVCGDATCGVTWAPPNDPTCPACGGPSLRELARASEPAPAPVRAGTIGRLRDGQLADPLDPGTVRVLQVPDDDVDLWRAVADTQAPDPARVAITASLAVPPGQALTWIARQAAPEPPAPRDRRSEGPPTIVGLVP